MIKMITTALILTTLALADGSVLKTGQVKSYDIVGNIVTDGSIKDDGYYQTGKARSYGRIGNIVIDNATGLQWQDDVDSARRNWANTGSTTAAEYCSTLSMDSHSDWRLPHVQELMTLSDASQYNPTVTEGIFSHISSDDYWSSTICATYTIYAWVVTFDYGALNGDDTSYSNYVRCVRGGQFEPSHFSRNDATDIVTDTMTGLQWQDDDAAITINGNWTTAIDYCENTLAMGGYNWRLPSKNEMLSIVDYSQHDPAISPVFANRSSDLYWSSTTLANFTSYAWDVDFESGNVGVNNKVYVHYVRCVRGGQSDTSASLSPVIMYLLD